METKKRFKYNVINKKGEEEPWTGVFNSFEESQSWYNKHGINFINQGHNIVLRKVFTYTFYERWLKRWREIKATFKKGQLNYIRCNYIIGSLNQELKLLKDED
jgi:hypothetical protein